MRLLSFLTVVLFSCGLNGIFTDAEDQDLFKQLEDVLQDHLSEIQRKMKIGFPSLNISSMDPLVLGGKDFVEENKQISVVLKLKQINILGLSSFQFKTLQNGSKSVYLDINFPYLTVRGLYRADGKALKIFPIYGEGGYNVEVVKARMNFTGDFVNSQKDKSKIVFQAKDTSFDYQQVKVRLENFLGGGSFSQLIQSLLSKFAKDILEHVKTDVEIRMKLVLNQMINEAISNDNIQNIVKSLISDRFHL